MIHPRWLLLGPVLLALGACSSTESAGTSGHAATGCVDDSKRCIELRGQALKTMLADGKRSWVRKPESTAEFATGVKLFAYRSKKGDMTCGELAHGRNETQVMPASLKSGAVPGMNDSRLSQVRDLSLQVNRELAKEFDRVCLSPTQAKKGFEPRAPKA